MPILWKPSDPDGIDERRAGSSRRMRSECFAHSGIFRRIFAVGQSQVGHVRVAMTILITRAEVLAQ